MLKRTFAFSILLLAIVFTGLAFALNTGDYGYTPGTEQPNVDISTYPTNFSPGTSSKLVSNGNPLPPFSANRGGLARFFMLSAGISQNDTVVNPNCKNCTHPHWNWGNKEVITNARKDLTQLLQNCVSTNRGGAVNCSAYWAPAMVDISDGSVQPYSELTAYYKIAPALLDWLESNGKKVVVPPLGLRFVSGQASNSTVYSTGAALNGPMPRMVFGCTEANGTNSATQQATIPPCGQGGTVNIFIKSPHCWDGANLDSADHFSHMAMPLPGPNLQCPASHPIVVSSPESYGWKVPVTKPSGTLNWMLSSDNYIKNGYNGGLSGHIDWVNAWGPEEHLAFTEHCINQRRDSSNALCDGRRLLQAPLATVSELTTKVILQAANEGRMDIVAKYVPVDISGNTGKLK